MKSINIISTATLMIIITLFSVQLASAQSDRQKQEELLNSLINNIDKLKEIKPLTTIVMDDISSSVTDDDPNHLNRELVSLLINRIRRPGDGVAVIFISNGSGRLDNQIYMRVSINFPNLEGLSFDNKILAIARYQSGFENEKKNIIRKVVNEIMDVPKDKPQTLLLESLYPLSRLLENEYIQSSDSEVWAITDMLQFSDLASVYPLPNSPKEAKIKGKNDATKFCEYFDVKNTVLSDVIGVNIWLTGGLVDETSSSPAFTILPFYWEAIFGALGAEVRLNVNSFKL